MASRIPKPKPSSATLSKSKPLTLDELHVSLTQLGAPQITKEELGRLYQGALGDVLAFVAEHVKGRKGCAFAREVIHRKTASTRSNVDKASSRLSSARKNMESVRRQLDERQKTLDATQHEVDRLQTTLNEKRRVNMLLDVLGRKENIRKRRFEEIARLLDDLRRKIQDSNTQSLMPMDVTPPVTRNTLTVIPRMNHTRDALTALHAHHVRLTRITEQPRKSVDAEDRLRQIIARTLSLSENDTRVGIYADRCTKLARYKAKRKVQLRPNIVGPDARPGDIVQVVRAKQKEVQRLSDQSIALAFLCDHFIKTISTFTKTTSETLRKSLEEESVDTKGYVAVLQWLICNSSRTSEGGEWEREVVDALGIRGNVSIKGILQHVERVIRQTHQRESFLKKAVLSPLHITEEQQTLIAEYKNTSSSANEATVRLLKRKAEKVEMGDRVVRDVEVILGERELLVGLAAE